jgi:hypothetical protein
MKASLASIKSARGGAINGSVIMAARKAWQ